LDSKLPLPLCQVTAIELIPRSDQLAVAGWVAGKGGMLSMWDLKDGKFVRELATPGAEVLAIAVSAEGRALASGDVDGNLDIWDLKSGAKSRSEKQEHAIEAVTFSTDGKLLAVGDGNRTARLMDAASGQVTRTLHSRSYIESLDFSPDGNTLAAGTRDPGLELWDLRTDAASRTLVATGDHFDAMAGFVAFSPDGRFVTCGGHGKDIAVFDAASGTLFKELRGHAHPVTRVAFLPDGRLVSGGEEQMVKMWDPAAGTCLASWVVVPADAKQHWDDQWVGVDSSGNFVSSTNLDRLVGWQTAGEFLMGAESPGRRQRVERLFQAEQGVRRRRLELPGKLSPRLERKRANSRP
jgi:WD40 repeat protein